MKLNQKIYVAGHNGLVGSAIMRRLQADGFTQIITRTMQELDLRNQHAVNDFFMQQKPDYVFLAAAKVGGIQANINEPAEFIYDNLAIELNVIHAAYKNDVKKLLFLGSSCIYPRDCPQPIKEEYLLTGALECSNDAYAVAKIAGIKMCQAYNKQYGTHFIACMPTNLYGPHDNFDLQSSHVLPALIAKFVHAKKHHEPKVILWGTGTPRREFLYVDDLADACLFLMQKYSGDKIINIGTGNDITILELAKLIGLASSYSGELQFDRQKPDGTPRKVLDVGLMRELGWQATTSLENGVARTLNWYLQQSHFEQLLP